MSIPESDGRVIGDEHVVSLDNGNVISLDEASRQLELAVHDAQVAFDCIALGNLDRAHTNAITARAAVDSAEAVLRAVLNQVEGPFSTEEETVFDADEVFGVEPGELFDAEAPEG